MEQKKMKRVSSDLREKVLKAGQGQLFRFLDKGHLSAKEEAALASQLETFDFDSIQEKLKQSLKSEKELEGSKISPMPQKVATSAKKAEEKRGEWSPLGYELISKGKVAFIVLAGGQGTRLGFNGPKGCYDVGMPSKKTLFQMQAERLLKLQKVVAAKFPDIDRDTIKIPYYIMTSPLNHSATKGYFEENKYFGLSAEDVTFFQQGTLPCLTPEGKLILETKSKVATAPDGNGGIYAALAASGALKNMERRGIKWMMACSVDNALIQVADPLFLGVCEKNNADVGNKTVSKKSWDESVGVVGMKDGKYNIVEYSEISEEMAKSTNESGELAYSAANICIHAFTYDFITTKALPELANTYHIARKKIPAANDKGEAVKPKENNGLKLEMFIFDVFPLAENFCNVDSYRKDNFAPVKNAPGHKSDSPDTARQLLSERGKRWLEDAGATVKPAAAGGEVVCEVTPDASLNGEGLDVFKGKTLQMPLVVMTEQDQKDISYQNLKGKPFVDGKVKHFEGKDNLNIYLVL